MFMMNHTMSEMYNVLSKKCICLHPQLYILATSGFEYKSGCWFLKALIGIDSNVGIAAFPDRTGYECFINSLSINDYVETDYLAQGIAFAQEVFKVWRSYCLNSDLVALISFDNYEVKVKFHVRRNEENWLSSHIEAYKEAVLLVDSTEDLFL